MKRILPVILCLLVLAGCSAVKTEKTGGKKEFFSGVWITYSQVDEILTAGLESRLDEVIATCKSKGITDIFLSIRPFCDSLYKSVYFPQNEHAAQYGFDVFEYIIKNARKNNIRIHAWINPYRVSTAATEVEKLPPDSPVRSMTPGQDYVISGGIYLNPASQNVIKLITEGVREILDNYEVDGIHFDDYFYPTKDESFDKTSYKEYTESSPYPLSLAEFRTANVNALIGSVYAAVKYASEDTLFSVSPCASIEKNRDEYFADVKTWCENGCVDMIIPQLYFGFEYPDEKYRFDRLLEEWKELLENTDTSLVIGLGAYKIHTDSAPDKEEWKNGEEIIKRQTEICRKDDRINGVVYFSLSDIR